MIKRKFIPNLGFEYTNEKTSIILQLITVTKENHYLTEDQLKMFIKITSNYLDKINSGSNVQELFGQVKSNVEDLNINDLTFYKFISKETYENFICKGKFQLGSLKYYREIERNESRDEKEGYSNLIFENKNRQFFTSAIAGFDYYLFCGTHKLDELKFMSKQFGEYVLKIKNIKSFADSVQKIIGAKEWKIQKVNYNDFKANKIYTNLENFDGANPELSKEIFNLIKANSVYPSIFMKPSMFKPENELRLAFKIHKNVNAKLNVVNKGLLKYIEVEKI